MDLSCACETETRKGTTAKLSVMEMVTNWDDGNDEIFDFVDDPIQV